MDTEASLATGPSTSGLPPSHALHAALTAKFWSKLYSLEAPTWSPEIEQLVNPHGVLRMQPPYVPPAGATTNVDEKLALVCAIRGIDPSVLAYKHIEGDRGTKVRPLS